MGDYSIMSEYVKEDKEGRLTLVGSFSPSRLKTLEACKWQYELKYNRNIYPDQTIIEPHSQLGSAMHDFAEKYDGSGDPRHIALLEHQSKSKYTLTDSQIKELKFMIDNLVNNIWPELEGKGEERFEVQSVKTEANLRGTITLPGNDGRYRSVPLNLKIDRLIEREDGKVVIVDYKKGQPNVASHMFQLLFYVTTYSQRNRKNVSDIDIWLVFPNEKKNWVRKVTGEELQELVGDFESNMAEKFDTIENEAPFNENDATPSFLCNFCPFKATNMCPTSLVLHGAENPEGKNMTFHVSRFEKGKRVKTPITPEEVLSKSSLW